MGSDKIFDLDYDVKEIINCSDPEYRGPGKLNPMEAYFVPLRTVDDVNQIISMFDEMIESSKEGPNKITDLYARISYLSCLAHLFFPFLTEAKHCLFNAGVAFSRNMPIEFSLYKNIGCNNDITLDNIDKVFIKLRMLSTELRHYHDVCNRVRQITGHGICKDCIVDASTVKFNPEDRSFGESLHNSPERRGDK